MPKEKKGLPQREGVSVIHEDGKEVGISIGGINKNKPPEKKDGKMLNDSKRKK